MGEKETIRISHSMFPSSFLADFPRAHLGGIVSGPAQRVSPHRHSRAQVGSRDAATEGDQGIVKEGIPTQWIAHMMDLYKANL